MTELTLDRVRSVLNTKASAYAVADYIRLLDTVGFTEVTAMDQLALEALGLSNSSTLAKRLHQLYVEAQEVLDRCSPEEVAIETQFTGINPKSSMAVAMARGVLLAACESKEVDVAEYAPTEAKRSITGKGNATKEEVQKMCGLIFGRSFTGSSDTPFDTTDAIALAYCHLNRTKARH